MLHEKKHGSGKSILCCERKKTKDIVAQNKVFQSPFESCHHLKAVPFIFNRGYWGSDHPPWMTHILQDPFTPHSCPKRCPWNWSKIQQHIEDKRCGSENDLYAHESLKTWERFSPKPRQYKTLQVRFPFAKEPVFIWRSLNQLSIGIKSCPHPSSDIHCTIICQSVTQPFRHFLQDHFNTHEMWIITEIK